MKNGETKQVGNAVIVCNVMRTNMSAVNGVDKCRWTVSRTTYSVCANGRQVYSLVSGYRRAVQLAEAL